MQTRFNGFERWINRHLMGVQSLDLSKVKAELAELKRAVKENYTRPFISMLIIEEIQIEEEIPNIWVVPLTTVTHVEASERIKKKKKKKGNRRIGY